MKHVKSHELHSAFTGHLQDLSPLCLTVLMHIQLPMKAVAGFSEIFELVKVNLLRG